MNVKESTERGVRAIWQLLFDFQKAQEITPGYHRQFGLCLYAKASFTKEDGGDESKFDVQTVKSFFHFMRQKRTTVPNLRKAVTFLNAHLKGEFYARLRHIGHTPLKISGAMVGHLLTVKNAIAASNAEKADLAWENRDELLDAIDEMFGKSLITKLISCAYQEQPPDKLKSMNPLLKVQFAAAFTYAMQTGRRGEESFKQKVVQRFVRKIEELGIGGTPCGFVLTNKSKRNKVGRREYATTAPHVDPLKDASANHGAMWMYRFVVMKERLPDFLDYRTCFEVPTFRKVTSITNMSGDSFRDAFKQFFVANNFLDGMITHQCRREVEQMLDNLGCQPENIARMCGHALDQQSRLTNVQTKSYLTNKPLECVLALTGTTTKNPSSYQSVMAHCVKLVPETLLRRFPIIGDLLDMRDKVVDDFNRCQSFKERSEKRLCTMKRSSERIVFDIKCFFVLCASRPMNENGANFLVHAKTFQEEHRNGTLRTIFLDPAFQSQEYLNFRSEVRSFEDDFHSVHVGSLFAMSHLHELRPETPRLTLWSVREVLYYNDDTHRESNPRIAPTYTHS